MKIELHLTKAQINFIANQMQLFEDGLTQINFTIQPREKKLVLSILSSISDKFYSKNRTLSKQTPSVKKATSKISLKWFEAYAINTVVYSAKMGSKDSLEIAIATNIGLMIDSKL